MSESIGRFIRSISHEFDAGSTRGHVNRTSFDESFGGCRSCERSLNSGKGGFAAICQGALGPCEAGCGGLGER